MKSHTLAFTEGYQGTDSGPKTVGCLGHQHEILALHLDREPALRIHTRNPNVLQLEHIYRSFVSSFVCARDFSTRAVEVVPTVTLLSGPDTSPSTSD